MFSGPEFRKSKRFEHIATVMIEDGQGGYLYYGQMLNYSSGGMCIGSDAIFNKGTEIKITLDQPLYKASPKNYQGRVRWCKELARVDFDYSFGIGVKFV